MRLRTEDRGIARPHEGTFPSAAATWVTLLAADRAACRLGHRQVLAADVADAFLAPASSSKPWGLQPPREGATRAPSGLSHSRFTYIFSGDPPQAVCRQGVSASVSPVCFGIAYASGLFARRPPGGTPPTLRLPSSRGHGLSKDWLLREASALLALRVGWPARLVAGASFWGPAVFA